MEHQDSHERRILALLKRQPNMTVGEIAASLSGLVQHEVRRALGRLKDAGLVERDGAPNLWYAKESKEKAPAKAENINYWKSGTLPSMEPSRPDALDHTLVLSRRGDNTFVTHSAPMGIEGVPPKTQQTVIKKVSPINSATFCKRDPRQAISGMSA
jgi:DNA-binding transcriptional ArsR family regulator